MFSKRAIERELTELEQTVVTPVEPLPTSVPESAAYIDKPNSVIHEESVTEVQAEYDENDVESHISQAMTTFASQGHADDDHL